MADKIKINAPKRVDKVEVVGLDDVVFHLVKQENLLSVYDRFAEDVIISCTMPEIPRFSLHDEEADGTMVDQAHDALFSLLTRYRRITEWMRRNGIDVESVAGDGGTSAKS